MKRIFIIRHAKSSWKDLEIDDFDRGLKKRGKRDIGLIANWLKSKNIKPDIVLCSPAKRAKLTLKVLKSVLGIKESDIIYDEDIYMAKVENLVKLICKIDDKYNDIFLIGHNPSLIELVEYLTRSFISNIPTSSVVAINLDIERWIDIKREKGDILFFISPKKLKEESK